MEYLNHYVNFKICSALLKLPILVSVVKHKLGHNFPQFFYRFEIGTFEPWIQVFDNSLRDLKLGFLNVALDGLLNFSQFMDEIEN